MRSEINLFNRGHWSDLGLGAWVSLIDFDQGLCTLMLEIILLEIGNIPIQGFGLVLHIHELIGPFSKRQFELLRPFPI